MLACAAQIVDSLVFAVVIVGFFAFVYAVLRLV